MSPRMDAPGLRSRSGSFGGVGKAGYPPLWKDSRAEGGVSSEALAKAGASAGSAEEMKDTLGVCPAAAMGQGPGKWTVRAPLPAPRTKVAAVQLSGKIFVIGGLGKSGDFLEEYDPAAASAPQHWEGKSSSLAARRTGGPST